jgi:Holliday junction DNA helicase RuvA
LTHLGEVNSEVRILIHTHVTQDSLRLFGFSDVDRRGVFSSLIGISGVGPKMALAILSMFTPPELADIASRGDKGLLVKIPGIGAKKAAKLLLELKDRLPKVSPGEGVGRLERRSLLDDLVSALVNLGFQSAVAEDAGRQVIQDAPAENNVALLVKQALQLTKRPN